MRRFNHKGSLFKGPQRACNLLSERCKYFLLYSPKFNKVPHLFPVDTHNLLDQWNHVKLCVGFLYFRISSFFFFLLVARRSFVDSAVSLQDWSWGSPFHNNWYQSTVKLKMSAIKFDIQKFDSVINFIRWQIRMNAIWTQRGLKKTLLGSEKSLKT